jgi:hypothetical protein
LKTFLIIATGAKNGGALCIINQFLEWAATKKEYNFIVIAPEIIVKKRNILHVKLLTLSLFTPLFCLLGSIFYIIKYKPSIVISFSNLPVLFSSFFKSKFYTYFHNLNIVSQNNLKSLIYRFLIQNFCKELIVQTQYTKKLAKSFFNKKIHVILPGILRIFKIKNNSFKKIDIIKSRTLFYPVSNICDDNKNFKFLINKSSFFKKNNIKIIIPAICPNSLKHKNYNFLKFVGPLKMTEMCLMYKNCIATIFLSLQESYGLPIYESLSCGRPTFVLERPYIVENLKLFKKHKLLIIFKEQEFEIKLIKYLNLKKFKKNRTNIYFNNTWSDLF